MINVNCAQYDDWHKKAKHLFNANIPPEQVIWSDDTSQGLFHDEIPNNPEKPISVPKAFPSLAKKISCYRNIEKWAVLYRVLWRLQYENKQLLQISTDNDVLKLHHMAKEINRDCHKMKAFVRFREAGENQYVAWHEPIHLIVECTAPFFVRRFSNMNWSILTPDACAIWDGEELNITKGMPRSAAPQSDDMEELWKTFYRHIFNPARIKVKMMKSEMPVKYWHTMPETALIPEMLEEADKRVQKMIQDSSDKTLPAK